jgi:glycosyltransferase involved in cell wall biosynthesis
MIKIDISIIMPAYNSEATIGESIKSVLSQSYEYFELIIVDDGSKDKTLNVVYFFLLSDPRIKLLVLKKNTGVAYARNCGLANKSGRYVCFLDSDDQWHPEKLSLQLSFMRENGYKCSLTYFRRAYPDGHVGDIVVAPKKITYPRLLLRNWIGNLTGMYDSQYLPHIVQRNIKHEDYLMWLQITKEFPCMCLKRDLALYNVSSSSLSSNKLTSAKWHYAVFRDGLEFSTPIAIILTLTRFLLLIPRLLREIGKS